MLLKTRHPLTRWAAALASAAVVAAGSLGIAPTASAVPRFAKQIAWTAPTMAVPYGTAITAVAGSGQFTLTPQTYSAGTWTPGTPVTTSSPVVAQAYDANGVAVDMTTITLPAATCALYAATDTTYLHPLTGTIAGPANYVTRCTAASTVAGYANAYVNGRGVVQGEATLTVTYPGLKSIDAVTTLGSYPSTLGYTSVKKNGISAAAPIATCGIYAAADTAYAGADYQGKTAPVGSYNVHCGYAADPLWATTYSGDVVVTVVGTTTVTTVTCPTSVTYTGAAQTPCTAVVTGNGLNQTVTPTYTNNTDAGTATASYSFAGDSLYAPSAGSATFTINQSSSSTVVTCPTSVSYTGSPLTPCSVNVSATDGLNQTFDLTDPTAYTSNTDAGTATASYTFPGDVNHSSSTGSATFQIHAASTTTVTCPTSVVYTGLAQTPCTVAVTDGASLSLTFDANYSANTNVGTATASYNWPGDATHDPSSGSNTFAITPATSTVTVNCPVSVVYSGSAQTPCTATITGDGGLNSTVALASTDYSNNTNVGTASASFTYAGDANHSGSTGSSTFGITQRAETITASSGSITYGDAFTPSYLFNPAVIANDLLTAPTCAVYATTDTLFAAPITGTYNAGSYITHCSGAVVSANLSASYIDGTLTVAKASSTSVITCNPTSVVYNGAAQTPCSVTITAPGISTTATPTYTNNTNVGTATASYAYTGTANVNGSTGSATFAITKAAATVTASSATIANGAATPAITFTTNPTPITWTTTPTCAVYTTADTTFATPLTGNRTAGTYVTHCANGVSVNYTPSYVNGTLTVTAAATPVTVTASTSTITYGATVPAVTFTTNPTPITWTTTPTCAVYTTADTTFATALTGVQNAGTYVTHCANGAATGYAPSYVNGALTINKAATVSVTASTPAAITYGAALPTVTSTTPTGGWTTAPTCGVYTTAASTTRLTGTQNAGAYVTKCSGGVAVNYTTVTYVNGTLTINKAAVTITAQTRTGTRGGAIPTPTFTSNPTAATYTTQPICRVYNTSDTTFATPLTGNFPNAAGTYVTRCSGAVSTNYNPSYVNGTITVA